MTPNAIRPFVVPGICVPLTCGCGCWTVVPVSFPIWPSAVVVAGCFPIWSLPVADGRVCIPDGALLSAIGGNIGAKADESKIGDPAIGRGTAAIDCDTAGRAGTVGAAATSGVVA